MDLQGRSAATGLWVDCSSASSALAVLVAIHRWTLTDESLEKVSGRVTDDHADGEDW